MSSSIENPYKAPEADVVPESRGDGSFAPFPRFSAWWVFLLSIVTLTFYSYYWLFTRSQVVNKYYPQHAISNGLIWSVLTAVFAQLLLTVAVIVWVSTTGPGAFDPDSSAGTAVDWLDTILGWAGIILWYIWVFAMRNRINRISGARPGDVHSRWAGPFLTFFFTVVYLAYKINRLKDME